MIKNNQRQTFVQFIKFAIVGAFNTFIDWGAFFLLTLIPYLDFHESYAKAISFIIAATNSFAMNSLWTFRSEFATGMKKSKTSSEKAAVGSSYFFKFFIVSLIGWGINTLIFSHFRFSVFNNIPEKWSKILALGFASGTTIIWNFFANKFWTYKNK